MDEVSEILIVDDLPDHIAFAGDILRSEGYKVYAANSGESALKFLDKRIPDLIVLDINLTGMDGLEVCRIIKSRHETKDIPVIFLTSENGTEMIRKGFEAGGCDYVMKPFVREEYIARVNAHLNIARHSRELARAYDELNNFCSAVSHDLKAPLNVMNMLIDMLKAELNDKEISEGQIKLVDMIQGKSEQMVIMIERLLDFSRMCNIKPNMKKIDLNSLIEESYEEQKAIEEDRNITLIINTLPSVYADEVLARTMLKNIMTNAFKFTRNVSNAVITVNSHKEDGYIVVSIKDNGAGFDMKYADKLFMVFQRLHSQEEFEGSGVGLAMVDRIMKRHGGKVKITGEVNKGAEVSLYFSS